VFSVDLFSSAFSLLGYSLRGFGVTKESSLPRWCKECDVLGACQGGCPKHRFGTSYYDEPGLHYLCQGYKKFFVHIRKYCHAMTQLLENALPVSRVMDAMKGPLVIRQQSGITQNDTKIGAGHA
jgi:uncharacterized protein